MQRSASLPVLAAKSQWSSGQLIYFILSNMENLSFPIHNTKRLILDSDFIDRFPVGVYRTTLEGKLVFCNKAFATLFGFDSVSETIDYKIIGLYLNKTDRGNFVRLLIEDGRVEDFRIQFRHLDGTPMLCAVTARAVMDDEGTVVYIDGVMQEIAGKINDKDALTDFHDLANTIIITTDLHGYIVEINEVGAKYMGFLKEELLRKPLVEYIIPRYRDQFHTFILGISKSEKDEGILAIMDKGGKVHYLEFRASLLRRGGGEPYYIKAVAWDVTRKIINQKKKLAKEKLLGVLEMAGGISHNLNQPLMIIKNLLEEIYLELNPDDPHYEKMKRVLDQVKKLNHIAKKVGGIKKYRAMEYVAGEMIVDIDKGSGLDPVSD